MTAVAPAPGATAAPPAPGTPGGFEEAAHAVDEALAAVAALDPEARDAALALRAAVEQFHHQALVTVVRTLRNDPRGKELLFELVDDPAVRAVLAVQGIIKAPLAVRVEQALDGVRPTLRSHGGDVDLVEVRDRTAVVRLRGACNGCSMSAVTLRETVDTAVVGGVEEIDALSVVEDQPEVAFIPLSSLTRRDPGWMEGPSTDDIPEGGMRRVDVGEESFVITRVGGTLSAFRNVCVHQGNTLDGGMIDDGVLVCPWHGFRFDATTGECMSAPGAQLEAVPLRVEGGRVSLRAPVTPLRPSVP